VISDPEEEEFITIDDKIKQQYDLEKSIVYIVKLKKEPISQTVLKKKLNLGLQFFNIPLV